MDEKHDHSECQPEPCPVCEGYGAWWPQDGKVTAVSNAGAFRCVFCGGTGECPPSVGELRNYR